MRSWLLLRKNPDRVGCKVAEVSISMGKVAAAKNRAVPAPGGAFGTSCMAGAHLKKVRDCTAIEAHYSLTSLNNKVYWSVLIAPCIPPPVLMWTDTAVLSSHKLRAISAWRVFN